MFINRLPDVSDLRALPTRKPKNDCANSKYLITGKLLRLSSAAWLLYVSLLVWSGGCSRELQECERRGKPTMLLEPPKSCTQATCVVPVVLCVQNNLPLKKRHSKIRDFNCHRFHSHSKGLGQALSEEEKYAIKHRHSAWSTMSSFHFSDYAAETIPCLENEWLTQCGNDPGKWLRLVWLHWAWYHSRVNLDQQEHSQRDEEDAVRERGGSRGNMHGNLVSSVWQWFLRW